MSASTGQVGTVAFSDDNDRLDLKDLRRGAARENRLWLLCFVLVLFVSGVLVWKMATQEKEAADRALKMQLSGPTRSEQPR